jgi:hypothetical protein
VILPAAASAEICAALAPKVAICTNTSFKPASTKTRSLSRKLPKRARWFAICVLIGTVRAPVPSGLWLMPFGSVTRAPPWP